MYECRMQKLCFWITVTACVWFLCSADKYTNERARFVYTDPKYIRNARAYTARTKRGDIYKTNITGYLVHPWGNNVSVELTYTLQGAPTPLKMNKQTCEYLKIKWTADYLEKYGNIKPNQCPIPAGDHLLLNIIFPPKNFPLPIPRGRNFVKFTASLTESKEVIGILEGILNVS